MTAALNEQGAEHAKAKRSDLQTLQDHLKQLPGATDVLAQWWITSIKNAYQDNPEKYNNTVADLLKEINEGETTLKVEKGKLVRTVYIARFIFVRTTTAGIQEVLLETEQIRLEEGGNRSVVKEDPMPAEK